MTLRGSFAWIWLLLPVERCIEEMTPELTLEQKAAAKKRLLLGGLIFASAYFGVQVLLNNLWPKEPAEPAGDSPDHYEWLSKHCDKNLAIVEKTGRAPIGRKFCTEAEEMRERLSEVESSSQQGANAF